MKKDELQVVIYTCDRKPNYLSGTIQSIVGTGVDKVYICQGSESEGNIEECISYVIYDELKFEVNRLNWSGYADRDVRFKAQRNYVEALNVPASKPTKYRLILEDDVKAYSKFLTPLERYIQLVEQHEGGNPFILTLYSPYTHPKDNNWSVEKINIDGFYGLQACLFSESITRDFSNYICENIASEPHDFLIKHFCKLHNINIWAVSHSLFQHEGKVTTGLGHHHQVGNFLGDLID